MTRSPQLSFPFRFIIQNILSQCIVSLSTSSQLARLSQIGRTTNVNKLSLHTDWTSKCDQWEEAHYENTAELRCCHMSNLAPQDKQASRACKLQQRIHRCKFREMNGTWLHLQVLFRTLSKYWKTSSARHTQISLRNGSGATKHKGNEYDIGTDMIYLQPLDYYKNSRVKASWIGLNHYKETAKLLERSEVRIPVGGVEIWLHSLISALYGDEWCTLDSSRLAPGKEPGTHCVGGWLGFRAGLDVVKKRKILCHYVPSWHGQEKLYLVAK